MLCAVANPLVCDVHHRTDVLHCHVEKDCVCVHDSLFWLFVYSADLDAKSPFCVGLVERVLYYRFM